jgi:predicted transcriptional regulator
MNNDSLFSRRDFVGASFALAAAASARAAQKSTPNADLIGEIGVTTGSFMRHLSEERKPGKLVLLDFPKVMRDELDMRVIDLMTATLPSLEANYLHQLRQAAEREGCILTNLKMNQPNLNLGTDDEVLRKRSIAEYKRTIDAAASLGVRWVRPLPGPQRPDLNLLAASYRELIDYAAPQKISLLIENYGWLANDADAIPNVINAVGQNLAAQPDTGNWPNNTVRYAGLTKSFPFAVSCDFKARTLGPQGEHDEYDLKRCFDIGWDAGFRGPWCFEYFHDNLADLYRDLRVLRDRLRQWITARR